MASAGIRACLVISKRPALAESSFFELKRADEAFAAVNKAGPDRLLAHQHFFWGSFDLTVTRFSGRPAPLHPGGAPNTSDRVMQEAYSHEVSSAGFWPGSKQFPQAAFYSYCYPTPATFGEQIVKPAEAFFSPDMSEFFLPYDAVRQATDPAQMLLDFLQSTYEAAAQAGQWDRTALECDFSSYET